MLDEFQNEWQIINKSHNKPKFIAQLAKLLILLFIIIISRCVILYLYLS